MYGIIKCQGKLTRTGPLIRIKLESWVAATPESTESISADLLATVYVCRALVHIQTAPSITGKSEAIVAGTHKRSNSVGAALGTAIVRGSALVDICIAKNIMLNVTLK